MLYSFKQVSIKNLLSIKKRGSNNYKHNIIRNYQVDHLVIGAGVIGLAVAAQLSKHGSTLVIEKNLFKGEDSSSRNSEVIHAGIYYPNNSLKTEHCIKGRKILYHICEKYNIPYKKIGKWIITSDSEGSNYLENLKKKCDILGVPTHFVSEDTIIKEEPNIKASLALSSPETGIIDSSSLLSFYEYLIKKNDGDIAYRTKFLRANKKSNYYISELIDISDPKTNIEIESKFIINCAGLYSASVSKNILRDQSPYNLYFCKGHYYSVQGKSLVSRLIYPIPDKNLVSLGIHTTIDMSGRMKLGPDVMYIDNIDYSFKDDYEHKKNFFNVAKQYLPTLDITKMEKDYCGIRPKLAGPGEKFKDFIIQEESEKGYPGIINLIGIESPGLTASPSISNMVSDILGYKCNTFPNFE